MLKVEFGKLTHPILRVKYPNRQSHMQVLDELDTKYVNVLVQILDKRQQGRVKIIHKRLNTFIPGKPFHFKEKKPSHTKKYISFLDDKIFKYNDFH